MKARIFGVLSDLLVPAAAVLCALLLGALVMRGIGASPLKVYAEVFRQCFGSGYGFGQILYNTTSLTFTGLAVALAFRAGLFNIGAEGQLYVGAFASTLWAINSPGLPGWILLPGTVVIGMVAAGAWAAVPGLLKARFGAHEVITTIMMNFVATAFVGWMLLSWSLPETVHTDDIPEHGQLPGLSVLWAGARGSQANLALLLAIAAPFASWFLMERTKLGYEIRAVGQNPAAAECAGIGVARITVVSMLLSGALAGLVGANEVLGNAHYFERDFPGGVGFLGIAVALLARNNPFGVVLSAFLFSTIRYGGGLLQQYHVPRQLADILAAVVILFVIVGLKISQRLATERRKRRAGA